MWPAFDQAKARFTELEQLLADATVIADRAKYTKLAKEHGALIKMIRPYDEYLKVSADLQNAEAMFADESGDPELKALHAGLECGVLGEKFPGLDMISFGPVIEGAHSPSERVQIDSVGRFYELLKATLAELARG